MGNVITYTKADLEPLRLSNGAMGVLMDILAISASDAATTLWEKQFARWIAAHDQSIMG